MTPDTVTQFFNLLSSFSPAWVLAILVAMILAWQTPQIIRELRRKRP